jgi:hypothetical protein
MRWLRALELAVIVAIFGTARLRYIADGTSSRQESYNPGQSAQILMPAVFWHFAGGSTQVHLREKHAT